MASPVPVPLRQEEIAPRPPATIALPTGFKFGPVPIQITDVVLPPPTLGPLADFVGKWSGSGFNTIFRPDSTKTPTKLPVVVPPGPLPQDNILELNLTSEELDFSASLGTVPNRGSGAQADIRLNGVPYLQVIKDVTSGVGIHVEPGMWIIVEPTAIPAEGQTVARMASIPHGTTIQAQGTSTVINGAPNFPIIDITPFTIAPPHTRIRFPSQTATNKVTLRIPQDLTTFITAGTITQQILDNPNLVLKNHLTGQNIKSTTQISVSTTPVAPIIGGGTDNIGFLDKNAQAVTMSATFWIETVVHTIVVPPFRVGDPPLLLKSSTPTPPGVPAPTFSVTPPFDVPVARNIIFTSKQIQYSQTVMLNFAGLTWPHISVATLVPSSVVVVPPTVWA